MLDKGGLSSVTALLLLSGAHIKWGDLNETEITESAASGITGSLSSGMGDVSSQKGSLAHFADQCAGSGKGEQTKPG